MYAVFPNRRALAINAERLFNDIAFTYGVVNFTVCNELERMPLPCSVRKLSSLIIEKFRRAFKNNKHINTTFASNEYLDSQVTSFLKKISKSINGKNSNELQYNGVFFDAMQRSTMLIFEYMNETYELIDDHVLEELKQCIFKAFAYQCGMHLAYCFLDSPNDRNRMLKEINKELTNEV
jgi:hypothetical protein